MLKWNYLESDRELFERELETFVPPRVFDAHAHLYDRAHLGNGAPPMLAGGPQQVGWETYLRCINQITPEREMAGLFFGFPTAETDIAAANKFVNDEIRHTPSARGQMLIRPDMDPEFIRDTVHRNKFVGLKCYHVYATETPTFSASIGSYLPEAHVRIAHDENLTITLHMVRPRAMADPANQQ